MTRSLIIWGASGHAVVVADIIRCRGEFEIVGFLDDVNLGRKGEQFCTATILGGAEQLHLVKDRGVLHLIVAFGDCEARLRAAELVHSQGFELVTAVHPSAVVASDVVLGPGTVVAAGAVVNPSTVVGDNVIINTGATVDHHCNIAPGVHICPGVHLGGNVQIGRATWIGIGATIRDRVCVGAGALVGAGAVVVKDIPNQQRAWGVPARPQS